MNKLTINSNSDIFISDTSDRKCFAIKTIAITDPSKVLDQEMPIGSRVLGLGLVVSNLALAGAIQNPNQISAMPGIKILYNTNQKQMERRKFLLCKETETLSVGPDEEFELIATLAQDPRVPAMNLWEVKQYSASNDSSRFSDGILSYPKSKV